MDHGPSSITHVLQWVSENPGVASALIGLAGTLFGGVLGLLAPWVRDVIARRREAREDRRQLATSRREFISSWRKMVQGACVYVQVSDNPNVYRYLIGRADFQSLEAHTGERFRGGITLRPALQAGCHMPEPLESITRAIDELERTWGLHR